MLTVNISKEEAINDVPRVEKWINVIEDNFEKESNDSNTSFYYTYSFITLDEDQDDEYFDEINEKCSNMLFDERLEYEMSKVEINIAMKIDDMFISDRVNPEKDGFPEIIQEIISEVTKVKMILECEYSDNEEVKNSIPEIDDDVVSIETEIKDLDNEFDEVSEEDFDVDDILDKISKKGMDGLTEAEKKFLNDKSKNI
jgi:hypothetical protein